MIAKIVNTVISKIGLAIISILLLLLNSNVLGSEGLGAIGILVLEISIYLLTVNLVAGGSLIYYASKYKVSDLFLFSYLWVLLTAILFYGISSFTPMFKINYLDHVIFLGMIQSAVGIHSNLLVGKEQIKAFNYIALVQAIVQISSLSIFYFIVDYQSVESFIYSTYIAYGSAFLYSLIRLFPYLDTGPSLLTKSQITSLFNYGFYIQIANISQLLNYRLSYFLLQYFSGLATVGRFMPAVQISEGLLLPSKSIGIVQYSKISNLNNNNRSALLSLRLLKLVALITIPFVLIVMLLPTSFFILLFGNDFGQTPTVITLMGVGIIALACEVILSRYFSGTGNQKINASSSTLGLIVTVFAGLLLIPTYGLYGAAITTSLSYFSMFIFLLYHLIQKSELKVQDFGFKQSDYRFFRRILFLLLKKKAI